MFLFFFASLLTRVSGIDFRVWSRYRAWFLMIVSLTVIFNEGLWGHIVY